MIFKLVTDHLFSVMSKAGNGCECKGIYYYKTRAKTNTIQNAVASKKDREATHQRESRQNRQHI